MDTTLPETDDPTIAEWPPAVQRIPSLPPELQAILQRIADDVVVYLGCIGSMVATLEQGTMLPVRAFSFNIPPGQLAELTTLAGIHPISSEAVTYLDDRRFRKNLSARAVRGKGGRPEKYVVSEQLYDLFRPIIPRRLANEIQRAANIKQVVAVPFFLDDEVVGNLFAASSAPFSERDIEFLIAFGHQAAAALQGQRNLSQLQALERVVFGLQRSMTDETQALQMIVDAVVHRLGYMGAIVATLEDDNALPVRAYAVDMGAETLDRLERYLGVSFDSPRAVVYLDEERYHNNLSVRAVRGDNGRPIRYLLSDNLHDLFRPIINRTLALLAQKVTGIKQVIAVPFFLENNVVGNLFVASRKPRFSEWEIQLLTSFGQQAAIAIHNARLYRKSEERRQIAQVFARMAFSAATAVHALRNHLSVVSAHIQLFAFWPQFNEEKRHRVLDNTDQVVSRIHDSALILDNLHTPWQQRADTPINVNDCLRWAVRETVSNGRAFNERLDVTVHETLAEDLPAVSSSPDMLTEALHIIIKNGVEAVLESGRHPELCLVTRLAAPDLIEIRIQDNGVGIPPKNLRKIFDLGWSTKQGQGMGFGLFWTKDYIEGLQGTICVESEVGAGATFIIQLPSVQPTGS